jgi:hypothetical protein
VITTEMQVVNPDSVNLSLTITMSLGEWKQLRDQLARTYPSWRLAETIGETVTHVEQHFDRVLETKSG